VTDSALQASAAEIGGLLGKIREAVWNLGGNPGELRSAAESWRRLQADLHARHPALAAASRTALQVWNDEAAARFGSYSDKVASAFLEIASDCGKVASVLDEAARKIEDANAELHGIYVQIGLMLGVDLFLQLVPLVDAVADAATVARAAAPIGRWATIGTEIAAFVLRLGAQFVINSVTSLVIRTAERWIVTGSLRNAFQWTQTDFNQVAVGSAVAALPVALVGARGGLLLTSLPRLARFSVSLREVRLRVGAFLRVAEPYPTYMLTAAAAGMGSSALNSLMDNRRPTWGQVLQAGAISAGLAVVGGGSAGFFSRLAKRGAAKWPAEAPFGRQRAPLFPRLESGEVLTPPLTVREWDLQTTMRGLYVKTGGSTYQRVRDLGFVDLTGGNARYIPRYTAGRLPPGIEPVYAKPRLLLPISSGFNLGIDASPWFGPPVRHARHIAYPVAAPIPPAIPHVHPLALPDVPAPGHLPRHVVRLGDTLWDIAARQYGNPFAYREIARRNRIANPDLIYPGEGLVLPAVLPPG